MPDNKKAAEAAPEEVSGSEEPVEDAPVVPQTSSKKVEKSRPVSMYGYIKEAWKVPANSYVKELQWHRMIEWRREGTFTRIERPTRLDRARTLGYKAKQGYVIVRTKTRRGSLRKPKIRKGRRAKRRGRAKITMSN